ncbi:hypothetical protein Baya_9648 [Bagarius yarrelli]|uniref:Uncharacterized protein n=1 Tax=Bagarius yarrelli TaxID=175774 RepID=A0A556UXU6_BAGYA|nr:hypothetical protein Baya_9648 [Bagarius yarrelli]
MSHCRKRCKRQLTKVARFFYRFLTGTLTQGRSTSLFAYFLISGFEKKSFFAFWFSNLLRELESFESRSSVDF